MLGEAHVATSSVKPRRPWVAILLSLFGVPVGQIYAGRLRRSLVLWAAGAAALPLLAFVSVTLPIGRLPLSALLCFVGIPIVYAIDAYFVAKRQGVAPLQRFQRWWIYPVAIVVFLMANSLVGHFVRHFVAETFAIPARSMSPTIIPGDRILVDKLWSSPSNLKRGDVVVFRSAGQDSPLWIMRLVGLPGDEIEIANEKVLLNGVESDDAHAFVDRELPAYPELTNYGPLQVPPNFFFVVGDNRRLSKDSRVVGPIPFADFHGKASVIYWSRERRFPDLWDTSHYEPGPIAWWRIGMRLD
jgi:signal peptidase I